MNRHAIPLLLALAAASAQAAPLLKYRITPLLNDYDPEWCMCEFRISEINNHGMVAGSYDVSSGYSRAFTLDKPGAALNLIEGTGRGYSRYVVDLNDRGEVLVDGDVARHDITHTYLYRGDRQPAIDISLSEFDYSYGWDLNEKGHAVGVVGSRRDRLFYYDGTQSRYLDLGLAEGTQVLSLSFNDAETLAGYTSGAGGFAFKVEDGRLTLLEGLASTYAINNAGQILGSTDTDQSAIRDADGRLRLLDFRTSGALNELGWTVGTAQVGDVRHGFLYRDGRSYDLNSLLSAEDAAQWMLGAGVDINEHGQIVGNGLFNGKPMPFLATLVPEPGTYALMLCGLGVVGWAARQRRGGAGASPT